MSKRVPPGDDFGPEDCSHDERYLEETGMYSKTVRFVKCRRCGLGLRLVNGHRLKVNREPKVVDFSYECIDCGAEFDYPSGGNTKDCIPSQ